MLVQETLTIEKNISRSLGAAFVLQAVAAVIWTVLLGQLIIPGNITESMINIANSTSQMRVSIVVTMITAMAIVILGSLLYITLKRQNGMIALAALGLYLLEVAILTVSRLPAFALLRLSEESVATNQSADFQTLGQLLYEAAEFGDWLHMFPFALGAILFYYLFFKSGLVPRALSLFGLFAAILALVGTALALLGYDIPIFIVALSFPFEIGIGVWLIVKGFNSTAIEALPRHH